MNIPFQSSNIRVYARVFISAVDWSKMDGGSFDQWAHFFQTFKLETVPDAEQKRMFEQNRQRFLFEVKIRRGELPF